MIYKFTEVLNDLVNYFILGDILLLESWKRANNLSDDLATEFTTNESGDRAFSEGIVIPMSGIENYPYTVLFNLSGDKPELCKGESRLQFRRSGYSLKVDNNRQTAVHHTCHRTHNSRKNECAVQHGEDGARSIHEAVHQIHRAQQYHQRSFRPDSLSWSDS